MNLYLQRWTPDQVRLLNTLPVRAVSFLLLVLYFCIPGKAIGLRAKSNVRCEPMVVLYTVNDGWSGWFGVRTPEFVLYADGKIIYTVSESSDCRLMTAVLTPDQVQSLLSNLRLEQLVAYASRETSAYCDDCTTTVLCIRRDDGSYIHAPVPPLETHPPETIYMDPVAEGFQNAVRVLEDFRAPMEYEWMPERVELRAWDLGVVTERSKRWPAMFPHLATLARADDREYRSTTMRVASYKAVRGLLGRHDGRDGSKEPALVNDGKRTWRVYYRPQLPFEHCWRK